MIVFGNGHKTFDLGSAQLAHCGRCGTETMFHYMVRNSYPHVSWVLRIVIPRSCGIACPTCRRGWEIDKAQCRPTPGRGLFPSWNRRGLLIAGSAVLGSFQLAGILAH